MKVNNPHNYVEPLSDRLREIALDLKEIKPDIMRVDALDSLTVNAVKYTSRALYDLADKLDSEENARFVSCDICGDYHDIDSVPLSCESGDGE